MIDIEVLGLLFFRFFMLSGVFATLLLPETMQMTLEELSTEEQPTNGFVDHADRRGFEEGYRLQAIS